MAASSSSLQQSANQFGAACEELHRIADINRAAVTASMEAFDHSSPDESHYAPGSVAMAFRQVLELNKILSLLAISYELAEAAARERV